MSDIDTFNSDAPAEPKANFAPLTKPAAPPLGRSYAAGAAEERRSPQPRKLDKQWTKALDKASVENERAAYKSSVLTARNVGRIHYKGLNDFLDLVVGKDTDMDEYKNLVNQFIDGILGKPDYRYSPHKWTDWMRGCIANRCMEAGIKNPTNIDQIRDDVLEVAETDGRMGDDTYILDLLKEEIRAFSEQIAELDWRTAPDAFHKFVTEVKAGDFFVRQILGPTVAEWPPVRLEALRLVREAQAAAALDGDGKPIAASVKPDWSTAVKAAEKMQAPVVEQPKTHEMDPDKMTFAVPAHIKRELKLDDKTIGKHIRQAFGMELGLHIERFGPEQTWKTAENYVASQRKTIGDANAEPPAIDPTLKAWFPESAAAADARHGASDKSENEPQASQMPANDVSRPGVPEMTNDVTSTPSDVNLIPSTTSVLGMSEAGFSVNFKWVDEYGSEEQFTMRETTWEKGLEALPRFKARIRMMGYMPRAEYEAKHHAAPAALPSNVIPMAQPQPAALPMAVGQAAPVAAPQQATSGAPDGKGRVPGQVGTDTITGVKKTVDNGKVTIELWGTGKYAEHHLRRDHEHAFLTALGYDVAAMVIGNTYPATLKADWIVINKKRNNGNYFVDVVAIRA